MAKSTVKGSAPRLLSRQLYDLVHSSYMHTQLPPDTAPKLLDLFFLKTTKIHFLIRSRGQVLA